MQGGGTIVRILAPFFGGSTTIFGSTFVVGRSMGIVHNTWRGEVSTPRVYAGAVIIVFGCDEK